jgi:hypothetical protein
MISTYPLSKEEFEEITAERIIFELIGDTLFPDLRSKPMFEANRGGGLRLICDGCKKEFPASYLKPFVPAPHAILPRELMLCPECRRKT